MKQSHFPGKPTGRTPGEFSQSSTLVTVAALSPLSLRKPFWDPLLNPESEVLPEGNTGAICGWPCLHLEKKKPLEHEAPPASPSTKSPEGVTGPVMYGSIFRCCRIPFAGDLCFIAVSVFLNCTIFS